MASICDRTPCDGLLEALGKYIFGSREGRKVVGFLIHAAIPAPQKSQHKYVKHAFYIEYCPFCGTRIEEVNAQVVAQYTKPAKPEPKKASQRKGKYGYE